MLYSSLEINIARRLKTKLSNRTYASIIVLKILWSFAETFQQYNVALLALMPFHTHNQRNFLTINNLPKLTTPSA